MNHEDGSCSSILFYNDKSVNSLACQLENCALCTEDGSTCILCLNGYSLNDQNECHLNSENPNQTNQSCKTLL